LICVQRNRGVNRAPPGRGIAVLTRCAQMSDQKTDALQPSYPVEDKISVTSQNDHPKSSSWLLFIGCIGVVYGDIGTSPLYAFREAMMAAGAAHNGVQRADVIGILSLILWSLTIIVTLKYVVILLRADNDGEGGTLSLMALAQRAMGRHSTIVFLLGVTGASLFFGDSMITPAISVLSAVEGLKLVTPAFTPYVLAITIGIIIGLFMVQKHGTAAVANFFGPITAIWFLLLGLGGFVHLADDMAILQAINPVHAVSFLINNGTLGLIALGSVFLAVTGAEALYADMGHFGRKPIQLVWIVLVFPALALNYLGQGALVLAHPDALENPFFLLYPEWALLGMVILATIATIIASQAVITGAYSLSRQAIQLGLLPRLEIRHTSAETEGQIYLPQINMLLLIGVLFLVVLFGSSDKLATAYGIAVTGTMVVTACLAFIVVWRWWNWPVWAAGALMLPFLIIDAIFLGANLVKIFEGGYVPLGIGILFMISMWTWMRGTQILREKTHKDDIPLVDLIDILTKKPPMTVKGTAVFLTGDPETAPPALMHSLKHYKVLHEKNVMLTVINSDAPRVAEDERIRMEPINDQFMRVFMTFGYMDEPNVPKALAQCRKMGWRFDIMSTSFFVSRRTLKVARNHAMPLWQDQLFIRLAHNAADASSYFQIPTGRVVEIGAQVSV
jgi:KUP system potassium uptake protein